ncbi:MAG TPA: hypothetical protein VMR31_05370 [Myxococcota bacterium]|nr:hypothetical protein [Myxococcota bacterium]
MKRAGIAVALVVALAGGAVLVRMESPSEPAPAASIRVSHAREAEPTPNGVGEAPVAAERGPAAAASVAPARPDATRAQTDLRALEDQALRQIDVVPILRAAGLDPTALEARPDGNDVLRHVAADELITRSIMHGILSGTIYPYGYPRAQALADARAAADRMMAAMTPEARVDELERALVDGSSAEPEPQFYGPDSGRVFAEGQADADRGESPSN